MADPKEDNAMARMNSRNRKKLYWEIAERDGEYCWICGNRGNYLNLVIDHWDNNNENNAIWNLHLVCRSDNTRKNPRGPGRGKIQSTLCVGVEDFDRPRIMSAELAKNLKSEPRFRHWIYNYVRTNGRIELEEALNTGAEIARCSQEAVKRYIKKICCAAGLLRMVKTPDEVIYIEMRPPRTGDSE